MLTRQTLHAATLAIAMLSATPAMAAKAFIFTSFVHPGPSFEGPGFATAEVSNSHYFGQANGYEFRGGVGASAFAATSGRAYDNVQVRATASLADSFRVSDTSGLAALGGTVFQLDVPIIATGTASASSAGQPASSATADYFYSWNVGGFAGSGGLDVRANEDGTRSSTRLGGGAARTDTVSLFVRHGESVGISFFASAGATATSNVNLPSNGAADFGHTLRWGGVQRVRAFDALGNAIALSDDFRLSLLSDQSGFDYFEAAGRNPFTSAVPEPASWAMMIAGFGLAGATARQRRRRLQPA